MKKILTQQSLDYVKRVFGDINYLEQSRVFCSFLLIEKEKQQNLKDFHIMIKNEYTPSISPDWEMFSFLRCICNTFITSDRITISESKTTSQTKPEFFNRNDWKELYYLKNDKKANYVMQKEIEKKHIETLKPFSSDHLRTLLTKSDIIEEELKNDPNFKQLLKSKNIEIVPEVQDLAEAINYLKGRSDIEKILVEIGITTVEPVINIPNPDKQLLDFLAIGVYRGQIGDEFIGKVHPSLDQLNNLYQLVFTSEQFPTHKGSVQFYNYKKK